MYRLQSSSVLRGIGPAVSAASHRTLSAERRQGPAGSRLARPPGSAQRGYAILPGRPAQLSATRCARPGTAAAWIPGGNLAPARPGARPTYSAPSSPPDGELRLIQQASSFRKRHEGGPQGRAAGRTDRRGPRLHSPSCPVNGSDQKHDTGRRAERTSPAQRPPVSLKQHQPASYAGASVSTWRRNWPASHVPGAAANHVRHRGLAVRSGGTLQRTNGGTAAAPRTGHLSAHVKAHRGQNLCDALRLDPAARNPPAREQRATLTRRTRNSVDSTRPPVTLPAPRNHETGDRTCRGGPGATGAGPRISRPAPRCRCVAPPE